MKTKLFLLIMMVTLAFGVDIDPELDTKLELLKEHTQCSFIISSGVRTPEHNKKVKGTSKSFHLVGKAYDVVPECDKTMYEIGVIATGYFNGVIVYSDHIHLDVGDRVYHKLK